VKRGGAVGKPPEPHEASSRTDVRAGRQEIGYPFSGARRKSIPMRRTASPHPGGGRQGPDPAGGKRTWSTSGRYHCENSKWTRELAEEKLGKRLACGAREDRRGREDLR